MWTADARAITPEDFYAQATRLVVRAGGHLHSRHERARCGRRDIFVAKFDESEFADRAGQGRDEREVLDAVSRERSGAAASNILR